MKARVRRRLDGPKLFAWQAKSWREAVSVARRRPHWLFRGQSSAEWKLTTSLERTAKAHGFPEIAWREQEEEIVNQFKRQAHQHLSHLPKHAANLEWLSLIQHHGGPTRLLDFTRSFYVAAFFATETATGDAVVWAINQSQLDRKFIRESGLRNSGHAPSRADAKTRSVELCMKKSFALCAGKGSEPAAKDRKFEAILGQPNVIAVRPWQLNQRMIIQQGWFLFPTSLDTYFEHNLCNAMGVEGQVLPDKDQIAGAGELRTLLKDQPDDVALVRMVLPRSIHLEALQDLQRMNITAATLFPGLDGFARSLRFSLRAFDGFEETADGLRSLDAQGEKA